MGGAFQTSRDIFNNPIWQDVPKFRIFFFIVGNAVFSKDGMKVGNVKISRGQYLRSYRNLSDDLSYLENRKVKKYSISVLSRKIEQLVKEERLKVEDTELGTLFTVINYEQYQTLENYKNKLGTALEQGWNTSGTVLEQNWNNNKNVKESKEGKKENIEDKAAGDEIMDLLIKNNFIHPMGINKTLGDDLDYIESSFGFENPKEMILEAIKDASRSGGRNWKYIYNKLYDWKKQGVKNKSDLEKSLKKHNPPKRQNKLFKEDGEQSDFIKEMHRRNIERDKNRKPNPDEDELLPF